MKLFSFAEMNPAQVIFLKEPARPLLIDELVQYHTYRHLVLGVPEDKTNEELSGRVVADAKSRFGGSPEPYVIPPVLLHSYSFEQQQLYRKPLGEFEPSGESVIRTGQRFPKVTCIASLRCPLPLVAPGSGGEFAYSSATVIWFQENFAFPIDSAILARIQVLDWSTLAVDKSD